MIIIYKEFKDGKAEFTKKEIEELLEKARQEGYNDGYSKGYSEGRSCVPITYPIIQPTTTPTSPIQPISPIWTCNTHHQNLN